MHAVAGTVEADPGDADGIVGAGRQNQFVTDGLQFGGFRNSSGIDGIVWIRSNNDNVKLADGSFLDFGGNTAWKMGHQISLLVKSFEVSLGEMDDDKGRFVGGFGVFDIRNFYNGSGSDIGPVHAGGSGFLMSKGFEWATSPINSSSVS